MAYKSIVVGYSLSREDSAESISLPTVGGYTYQSSISSDYSKVISIDASVGKTAAEIAGEYVRAIVFNGGSGGDSGAGVPGRGGAGVSGVTPTVLPGGSVTNGSDGSSLYAISLSPTTMSFGSLIAGYTAAPPAQTLTITNSGSSNVTVDASALSGSSYAFTDFSATSIAPGGSVTCKVAPKLGLTAAAYTSAVTVSTTQGSSADFTPSFTVEANTYNISLDPASLDFGSKTRGYLFRPTKKDVTVKNDGNTAVTFIAPSENDGYDIDVPADWTSPLAPGATRVFSVRPKAGLIAGTYTAPIAISTRQGSSASLSPSFIVNGSLSVDISGDMDIIAGESTTLTANVTGGTGDYSYAWSGGGLTGADTRSVTVSPVSTTTYTVTVTDLGEGNEQASATVTVTAATHGIRLSVDDVSFSPVAVGYVQPVAHTVTVLYVGNIGSVTLIQPTATDYESIMRSTPSCIC